MSSAKRYQTLYFAVTKRLDPIRKRISNLPDRMPSTMSRAIDLLGMEIGATENGKYKSPVHDTSRAILISAPAFRIAL